MKINDNKKKKLFLTIKSLFRLIFFYYLGFLDLLLIEFIRLLFVVVHLFVIYDIFSHPNIVSSRTLKTLMMMMMI